MIVAAQNFGQQTAAQIFVKISAGTRQHRCCPKNYARKFAGRRPAKIFRDRYDRTRFYDRKENLPLTLVVIFQKDFE